MMYKSTLNESILEEVGEVVAGGTPSKSNNEFYTKNGIAWITPKDLSINKNKFISKGEIDITELGLKNSSAKILPKNSVLFSSRAPIGYIAIAKNEVCTNQGFKSVIPKKNIGTPFMYYFLKNNIKNIENIASGTTFLEVSGSSMKKLKIFIPLQSDLDLFNTFCIKIFNYQEIIENEIEELTKLRDTLLPKLMSGELDVSNLDI